MPDQRTRRRPAAQSSDTSGIRGRASTAELRKAGVALPAQALHLLESNTVDSLHESLRKIGLTLESRRAPMEVLVIDQIEKAPTEN